MLALEGLDGGAEDGIVQVGAGLDRLGPDAFGAGFVDEGVDYFVLGLEGAVSVIPLLATTPQSIHRERKGRTTNLRASSTERSRHARPSDCKILKSFSLTRDWVTLSRILTSLFGMMSRSNMDAWLKYLLGSSSTRGKQASYSLVFKAAMSAALEAMLGGFSVGGRYFAAVLPVWV